MVLHCANCRCRTDADLSLTHYALASLLASPKTLSVITKRMRAWQLLLLSAQPPSTGTAWRHMSAQPEGAQAMLATKHPLCFHRGVATSVRHMCTMCTYHIVFVLYVWVEHVGGISLLLLEPHASHDQGLVHAAAYTAGGQRNTQ